jgi:hypothetical protein
MRNDKTCHLVYARVRAGSDEILASPRTNFEDGIEKSLPEVHVASTCNQDALNSLLEIKGKWPTCLAGAPLICLSRL